MEKRHFKLNFEQSVYARRQKKKLKKMIDFFSKNNTVFTNYKHIRKFEFEKKSIKLKTYLIQIND